MMLEDSDILENNLPILYKQTSTGATQIWYMETLDGKCYRSVSGQIDGALVESSWRYTDSKNVGRANQTTETEQVCNEVRSSYEKKLNQGGYHESILDIHTSKYFKPMLAKKYEDYQHKLFGNGQATQDLFSQPKLDGVRCIATQDGLWSRTGKPLISVPHVLEALEPIFRHNPEAIFDGELYADKFADDFNSIISLVRKSRPTLRDLAESKASIQYHVYDFTDPVNQDELFFEDRFRNLHTLMQISALEPDGVIRLVPTTRIEQLSELDNMFARYMESGYEGQMVRLNMRYENKRSGNLLKRKEFQDNEYRVIEIMEGVGNRSGMAGFIRYELGDGSGRSFSSGIRGSHDYCRELLQDKEDYVGNLGTVRFFNLTPDGIPRFPITVTLHGADRLL